MELERLQVIAPALTWTVTAEGVVGVSDSGETRVEIVRDGRWWKATSGSWSGHGPTLALSVAALFAQRKGRQRSLLGGEL